MWSWRQSQWGMQMNRIWHTSFLPTMGTFCHVNVSVREQVNHTSMHQPFPRLSRYRGVGLSGKNWALDNGLAVKRRQLHFFQHKVGICCNKKNWKPKNPGSWIGWKTTTNVFPSDLIPESFGSFGIVPNCARRVHNASQYKSTSPDTFPLIKACRNFQRDWSCILTLFFEINCQFAVAELSATSPHLWRNRSKMKQI